MRSRQSGTTTQQMINCPHGAFYLWPNNNLHYAIDLLRCLGREDIKVRSYHSFIRNPEHVWTREAIIIDHACFDMRLL